MRISWACLIWLFVGPVFGLSAIASEDSVPAEQITYELDWTVDASGEQKRVYDITYKGPKTLERFQKFAGAGKATRIQWVRNLIPGLHTSDALVSSEEMSPGHFRFKYQRPGTGKPGEKAETISPLVIFLPTFLDPVASPWSHPDGSRLLHSAHALRIIQKFKLKLPWRINKQEHKWSFSPGHKTHGDFTFEAKDDREKSEGLVHYTSELSVPEFKSIGNDQIYDIVRSYWQWGHRRLGEIQVVASEKAGASQRASVAKAGRYFDFGFGYGSMADTADFISGVAFFLGYSYEIPLGQRFYVKPVSIEYRRIGLTSEENRPQSSDEAGARIHLGYMRDRALAAPATGFSRMALDLALGYSWLDVQDGTRINRSGWFPSLAARARWGMASPGELFMRSGGIYLEYTSYFSADPLRSQFHAGVYWEL